MDVYKVHVTCEFSYKLRDEKVIWHPNDQEWFVLADSLEGAIAEPHRLVESEPEKYRNIEVVSAVRLGKTLNYHALLHQAINEVKDAHLAEMQGL